MQKYNNILAFIDVDNCAMTEESYDNIIKQLTELGDITTAKIYGVNQKKHRVILEHASDNGFDVAMPMRVKKRGAKVLDNRILVDVMTSLYSVASVDAVAVVCAACDMVPLYRELKKFDIAVLALDNSDDATNALIDDVLDLGIVEEIRLPRTRAVKPVAVKPLAAETKPAETKPAEAKPVEAKPVEAKPVEAKPVESASVEQPASTDGLGETEMLLAEIARLREENNAMQNAPEQPTTIVEEAQELQELVDEIQSEEAQPAPEVVAEPADRSLALDSKEDGDLLKRIEAIRSGAEGDDEELVARLKQLLLEDN